MLPRSILLHCSIILIGLESFSNGQQLQKRQQNQQSGDYIPNLDHEIENTYSNIENLIAASSRNSGRRSGNKKNKNSDDDYHVVYESKPQSYSNSYHHSDNYKEPERTRTYGNSRNNGGGGGGRQTTYSDNHNPYRRSGGSSRSNKRNNNRDEDYDDYDDSPQQDDKPIVEYDYDDSTGVTSSGGGYNDNEKFSRSTKDDYHKTGELKDNSDFDDFGLDHGANFRRGKSSGRSGRGNKGKKSYSNDDVEDSDYVNTESNEGFSSNNKRSRNKDDAPIERYEQRTRQALKEYGTLDGNAFLGAGQYRK